MVSISPLVVSGAGSVGFEPRWSLNSSVVSLARAWVSGSDIFDLPMKTWSQGSLLVLAPP